MFSPTLIICLLLNISKIFNANQNENAHFPVGGGFGGRKESGQLRFGGIDRPFKRPL